MTDSEFKNFQIERDREAERDRQAWADAGRRVQEREQNRHICNNCHYFHERWDAHSSYDGYCDIDDRVLDDVRRNDGCKRFRKRT